MATAFTKAAEWVKKETTAGKHLALLQSSMPEFRDGPFTVNRLVSVDPLLLGYFDSKLKLNIDGDLVRTVAKVGKWHGVEAVTAPPDVHLVKGDSVVAVIRQDGFASSDPKLFEDIAKEIYGIGGRPTRGVGVKDRWLDSIALLVSDRRLFETVFFAILFILLPPTLAAYSLAITASLVVPDFIRFGVVVLILISALYIARLYIRENLRQQSR